MNAAVQQLTPSPHQIADANNKAMHSMTACALAATQGLDALGISILCVTVHGSKPVIDVAATNDVHKLTALNSKNWQMHQGTCPVKKRAFMQIFAEYYGCWITWVKWER